MADLLESLVFPNSSQESFHSLAEHPSPSSPTDTTAKHDSATSQTSAHSQQSALQAAGLPIYGVDAYLAAPENAALLHRAPDRKGAPMKQAAPGLDPAQPISLGSKSSHHMTAFNLLCQQKGLVPDFQIDGDVSNANFGGILKVGDVTIASDERWHSKKEAREALAEMGLESVKGMEAKRRAQGTSGEKNWIGMLVGMRLAFFKHGQQEYFCLTISIRISSTHQSKPRTHLPRLLPRMFIQLHMYHSKSSRRTLRFLGRTISVQEGSTCKCRKTRR